MTTALIISNLVLWVLVVALLAVVYALARQIGVLHERVAPTGALMATEGLRPGETVPPMSLTALDGHDVTLGGGERRTLLFFLSPGCPVCKSLLPAVKALARQEDDLDVVLASDGDTPDTHRQFVDEYALADLPYVLSMELGQKIGVSKLPFAALVSRDGVLRSRGLVNNREHLDSLLTADELDVTSLQDYLEPSARAEETAS